MTAPAVVEKLKRRVQAGQEAYSAGRLDEAVAEWSSALRSAQRLNVPEALRTALRNNLAGLHHSLGDNRRARRLYRDALVQAEKQHGAESAAVATVLNNMAEVERSAGDPAAAEPLFRRALAILERESPRSGPLVSLLANTAECLRQMGKIEEAGGLCSRALEIAEALPGMDSGALGVLLNNAAGIEGRRDSFTLASALYERAIGLLTGEQRKQALRNHAATLRRYAASQERAAE